MLEWLLIVELVVIVLCAFAGLIGLFIAKTDPQDPIYRFCRTFWVELLWPATVFDFDAAPVMRPTTPLAAQEEKTEASDEDAFYGRVKRERDGRIATATLEVLVIPHAAADRVVGVEDGGLKIEVSGEAGDGRANKALIEMVSQTMGVKPYQVTLSKGHYQTRKAVQIQGMRPDELDAKLLGLG